MCSRADSDQNATGQVRYRLMLGDGLLDITVTRIGVAREGGGHWGDSPPPSKSPRLTGQLPPLLVHPKCKFFAILLGEGARCPLPKNPSPAHGLWPRISGLKSAPPKINSWLCLWLHMQHTASVAAVYDFFFFTIGFPIFAVVVYFIISQLSLSFNQSFCNLHFIHHLKTHYFQSLYPAP